MTFTGAEPLEINIPVIIAASGEKVTLDKAVWSDKEIEPVFYAGEKVLILLWIYAIRMEERL